MIKQRTAKVLLSGLMLMLFSLPTMSFAKVAFSSPIFVLLDSNPGSTPQGQQFNIWRVDGVEIPPIQISRLNYVERPIISPDGKWIAYRAAAQMTIDVIKRGYGDYVSPRLRPHSIWLHRIGSNSVEKIGDQPSNAVLKNEYGESRNFEYYSEPVWSPDSKQVGWVTMTPLPYEFYQTPEVMPHYTGSFRTYNVMTGVQETLILYVNTALGYEGPYRTPHTVWGRSFIAIEQETPYGFSEVKFDVLLFTSTGKPVQNALISRKIELLDELVAIQDSTNKELLFAFPHQQAFDTQSGKQVDYGNDLPAIAAIGSNPQKKYWQFDWEPERGNWSQVFGKNKVIVETIPKNALEYSGIAPAPDGLGVAFRDQNGGVQVLYDNKLYTLTLPGKVVALAWGASQWVLTP